MPSLSITSDEKSRLSRSARREAPAAIPVRCVALAARDLPTRPHTGPTSPPPSTLLPCPPPPIRSRKTPRVASSQAQNHAPSAAPAAPAQATPVPITQAHRDHRLCFKPGALAPSMRHTHRVNPDLLQNRERRLAVSRHSLRRRRMRRGVLTASVVSSIRLSQPGRSTLPVCNSPPQALSGSNTSRQRAQHDGAQRQSSKGHSKQTQFRLSYRQRGNPNQCRSYPRSLHAPTAAGSQFTSCCLAMAFSMDQNPHHIGVAHSGRANDGMDNRRHHECDGILRMTEDSHSLNDCSHWLSVMATIMNHGHNGTKAGR